MELYNLGAKEVINNLLLSDLDILMDHDNIDYTLKISIAEKLLKAKMPVSFYKNNEEIFFLALRWLFEGGNINYKAIAYSQICKLISQGYVLKLYYNFVYFIDPNNILYDIKREVNSSPLTFIFTETKCVAKKNGSILERAYKDTENLHIFCFLEKIYLNIQK